MPVRQAAQQAQSCRLVPAQQLVAKQTPQRLDLGRRPVRDVGQRALPDLTALAIGLPQQVGGRRSPVRNPIHVHDARESCRSAPVKKKSDIYLGTISPPTSHSDSLSMTCTKNPRQLPTKEPQRSCSSRGAAHNEFFSRGVTANAHRRNGRPDHTKY